MVVLRSACRHCAVPPEVRFQLPSRLQRDGEAHRAIAVEIAAVGKPARRERERSSLHGELFWPERQRSLQRIDVRSKGGPVAQLDANRGVRQLDVRDVQMQPARRPRRLCWGPRGKRARDPEAPAFIVQERHDDLVRVNLIEVERGQPSRSQQAIQEPQHTEANARAMHGQHLEAARPVHPRVHLLDAAQAEPADSLDHHAALERQGQLLIRNRQHDVSRRRMREMQKEPDHTRRQESHDEQRAFDRPPQRHGSKAHQYASPIPNATAIGKPKSRGCTVSVGSAA